MSQSWALPDLATADAVLAAVPEFAATMRELTPLVGGHTNRNYRLVTGTGQRYVARFSSTDPSALAIDRAAEAANTQAAANLGVGPRVIAYVPEQGLLVTEWLDGHTLAPRQLDDEAVLDELAGLARRLHAGPAFDGDFDVFEIQRRYLQTVQARGYRLPAGYLGMR